MRWRFPPKDPAGRQRPAIRDKVDAFWAPIAGGLLPADSEALALTQAQLFDIDPRLRFRMGPGWVAVRPADRAAMPLAEYLVRSAPSDVSTASVDAPPISFEQVSAVFPVGILSALSFETTAGSHRRIDVWLMPDDPQLALQATAHRGGESETPLDDQVLRVCVEHLLGDVLAGPWLGRVQLDTAGTRRPNTGGPRLAELRPTFAAEVAEKVAELPDRPIFERLDDVSAETGWGLFEFEASKTENQRRDRDLYVGASPFDELWLACRAGVGFASERFSKVSERFCFLKIDGEGRPAWVRSNRRMKLEALINQTLSRAGIGGVVGGGTGHHFTYVDLALLDACQNTQSGDHNHGHSIDGGIDMICQLLRDKGAPKRSWLLFHDDTWADEWVAVWPDHDRPPSAD